MARGRNTFIKSNVNHGKVKTGTFCKLIYEARIRWVSENSDTQRSLSLLGFRVWRSQCSTRVLRICSTSGNIVASRFAVCELDAVVFFFLET